MKTHIEKLRTAIQNVLNRLMDDVELKKSSTGLQEPDYVAQMAIKLPRFMARQFVVMMNKKGVKWGLSFRGCFIHQKPKIAYETPSGSAVCELGDLMFVLKDGNKYSASLIQFKRPEKVLVNISKPNDLKQLYVYTDWPEFKFAQKKEKTKYAVCPRVVGNAAQYGFICPGIKDVYFVDSPGKQMLANGQTLAGYIVEFIQRKTGGWMSPKGCETSDGWSRLIWDVIEKIESAKFRRSNINICDGKDRVQGGALDFILSANSENICLDIQSIGGCADVRSQYNDTRSGFGIVIVEKRNELLIPEPCIKCIELNSIGIDPPLDEVCVRCELSGSTISRSNAGIVSELFGSTKL